MKQVFEMKKVLIGGVVATGLLASGAAFAADLPSRQVEPVAPVYAAPAFTWTGFYVGVNAGYAWNANDNNNNTFYGSSSNDGGFTGGGQIGYNYQINQFVIGAEADINYADLKNKNNGWAYTGFASNSSNGIEWFGTVRARVGFAIDRALIYATGGFAYGGGGNDNNFVYNGVYYSQSNDTRTGWTVGGGVEYAFTDNITARIEGLYVNLGKENRNYFVPVVNNSRKDNEFGVVRAGLNYKFNTF
ncbi:outer membrane protein [Pseudochelatococcus contaminans]|uniref:Outer membrane immunogenic protein n=1 Tax=Pseudochelatococcus contaminans TaxID=1538103 RepID=A0A7W5Z564_9HYPH|nr:outer membrane immunogenic protein [Pseudochelatococcus contaminans]